MMNEMIPLKDWEREQQGLPPRPKKEVVIPEPEPPVVENQIYFKDLFSEGKEIVSVQGHLKSVENVDEFRFIGFNLFVGFRDKDGNSSSVSGWIGDGDFQRLKRHLRGSNVPTNIDKILG